VRALLDSTGAELLRLRKWPAIWVVIGAWLTLGLMFGYAFSYIGYRTGSGPAAEDRTREQLLTAVLPPGVPDVLVQGMPMFGAALAMVLGALAAGNGFGWGTWKTALTQGPSRGNVIGGSLVAVSTFVVATVVLTLVMFLATSTGIAAIEGQSLSWPALDDVAVAFGGGLLVLEMWTLLGYAVAVLAKGPALAIGLGLVWVLVVENLLRSVASLLSVIDQLTRLLPGTAGGSLVGAIIGGNPNGTPGVLDVVGAGRALVTVTTYAVVLVCLVLVVMRRRDVA
jgi:ABC-type transport system involved in multi-copper enzyme maturation permease subunit